VIETPRAMAAIVTLTLVLASLMVSWFAPASVSAQESTAATPSGSGTPAAEMCPVDSNAVPVAAADAATVYSIDSEASTASYEVQEVLTGQGDVTAVGTTNAFIGTILLDDAGTPLTCSTFYVDLRTLTTDEDRRDAQVQNVLETSEFPLGTFILTSVEGLDGAVNDGEEHTITLVGDLTIHGVTNTVSWEATVSTDGDTLTGTATTTITFGDFGMDAPVFGPVASIEEEFQLSINLTAAAQ